MNEYELIKMILEGKAPPPQFKKKDEGKDPKKDPKVPQDDEDEDSEDDQKAKDSPVKDDDNEDGAEEKDSGPPQSGDDQGVEGAEDDEPKFGQEDDQEDDQEDEDGDEEDDEPQVDGSSKTKVDLKPKMSDDELPGPDSKSQVAEDRLNRILRRISFLRESRNSKNQ